MGASNWQKNRAFNPIDIVVRSLHTIVMESQHLGIRIGSCKGGLPRATVRFRPDRVPTFAKMSGSCRKFLFLLCFVCLFAANAFTQNINTVENFPDANFRSAVESFMGVGPGGSFTAAEAAAKTGMFDCSSLGISDLTGIEYFTGIGALNCANNALTSLDVSSNTVLQELQCQHNDVLATLNISGLSDLIYLYCNGNRLSTLDLTDSPNLQRLACGYNELDSLDVSTLANLERLYCQHNNLTTLNVSNSPNLQTLYCEYNALTGLTIPNNSSLYYFNCESNNLTSLAVSNCSNLRQLYCAGNAITSLDMSDKPALTYLDCAKNALTSLDLTNTGGLVELYAQYNELTSLDVSDNEDLIYLYCNGNELSTLNVSNTPSPLYNDSAVPTTV